MENSFSGHGEKQRVKVADGLMAGRSKTPSMKAGPAVMDQEQLRK